MFKRRTMQHIIMPLLACMLTAVFLGCSIYMANTYSVSSSAAYFSSVLCAPDAAFTATQQLIDEALAPAPEPAAALPESPLAESVPVEQPVPQAISQAPAEPVQSARDEPVPEGMAAIEVIHYEQGTGNNYLQSGAATVRNCTDLSSSELSGLMMQSLPFSIEVNSDQPQVLIMHTHATESYELSERSWCDPNYSARNTDTTMNMVAVGAEMAAQLNAAGIHTVQDATLHDYPNYNGSYALSNATVRKYLEQYPSIKVVLDVHRDAIQRDDGTRIAPLAEIDGMQAAQVMIICGADLNGNLPNFRDNLKFASRWQDKLESMFPGLTRPVLFDYRYYNQDLTTGSLLIEIGGHGNTLEEAKYSGQLVGKALAALLSEG